jgi:uncharacterized protein YacL (UPF0231 family)
VENNPCLTRLTAWASHQALKLLQMPVGSEVLEFAQGEVEEEANVLGEPTTAIMNQGHIFCGEHSIPDLLRSNMIRCYRDSNGFCRVDANDVHPLISAYLEQDVQSNEAYCQEMTTLIDEVASGNRDCWSGTGNAHTVTVRPGEVSIKNEYDDSFGNAKISLDVFRKCIDVWKNCISSESNRKAPHATWGPAA